MQTGYTSSETEHRTEQNTEHETEQKAKRNANLTAFGLEVKKRVLERNMELCELSDKVGTTGKYMSLILHDRKSGASYLGKIAEELDIDLTQYPREYEIHTAYMQKQAKLLTAGVNEPRVLEDRQKDLADAQ